MLNSQLSPNQVGAQQNINQLRLAVENSRTQLLTIKRQHITNIKAPLYIRTLQKLAN